MAARCLVRDTKPQVNFALLYEVFARFLSFLFRVICFVSAIAGTGLTARAL